MTDAQFDRRLRDFLAGREPGPLPRSLREAAARVALDTPVPPTWRVWQVVVRRAGSGGTPTRRLALALLIVGLMLAAAAAALVVGASRTPPPVPGLSGWGTFLVGQPAPPMVMRNVAGTPQIGDDRTFEFEDRAGSLMVVYLPAGDGDDLAVGDVEKLIEARDRAPEGVVFIVASDEPVADKQAVSAAADAGIGAVRLPANWTRDTAAATGAAIVVIDRRGRVAAAFGGALPGPDQLLDVIDREVAP
jgi:hypothetical protein